MTSKLRWVTSSSGGQFTFLADGRAIREIAGAWFLFDQEEVVVARYATRSEAVKAVQA